MEQFREGAYPQIHTHLHGIVLFFKYLRNDLYHVHCYWIYLEGTYLYGDRDYKNALKAKRKAMNATYRIYRHKKQTKNWMTSLRRGGNEKSCNTILEMTWVWKILFVGYFAHDSLTIVFPTIKQRFFLLYVCFVVVALLGDSTLFIPYQHTSTACFLINLDNNSHFFLCRQSLLNAPHFLKDSKETNKNTCFPLESEILIGQHSSTTELYTRNITISTHGEI